MVSREFEHCVYDEFRVMGVRNHVLSLGSTEAIMGNWRKRPYECWMPDILPGETSLRVVFEVGLS
jgi:hypothetical protein